MMPPAFFCDQATMAWLSLEAMRMWATHGPGRTLVGPTCHVTFAIIALRHDYRAGHRLMQRVLTVGEARGYEPDSSHARFLNALGIGHWFVALEDKMREAERARDGLIQGGDLQNACYTYYIPMTQLFDSAPSLDDYVPEVESALAFARRTGSVQTSETYDDHCRLTRVLRAESDESAAPDSASLETDSSSHVVLANKHVTRAIAAALRTSSFGSPTTTAEGVPLRIRLTVRDATSGDALSGAAVYVWHCDRDGNYSLYSQAIANENYLRGVQKVDSTGTVTFASIFPACYSGRWPHIHFEVYAGLSDAIDSGPVVKTSQIALPKETCDAVYATAGYQGSVGNLSQVSLSRDNVFGNDAGIHQIASMSGDNASGYTAALTVGA